MSMHINMCVDACNIYTTAFLVAVEFKTKHGVGQLIKTFICTKIIINLSLHNNDLIYTN